jgi:hypothetical protein
VIVGERQVAHRPDSELVLAVGARDHGRATEDRAGRENGRRSKPGPGALPADYRAAWRASRTPSDASPLPQQAVGKGSKGA